MTKKIMRAVDSRIYEITNVVPGKKLPRFSSIGSCTLVYLTKHDNALCARCASKWGEHHNPVTSVHTYNEGPSFSCDECEGDIESSYGDQGG